MTVAQMIREKLDELGADGLMVENGPTLLKSEIDNFLSIRCELIPAFRHADGTYHAEKEEPCPLTCKISCKSQEERNACPGYQSWLSHKEEMK